MFGFVHFLQMSHEVGTLNGPTHSIIPKPRGKRTQYAIGILVVFFFVDLYLNGQSLYDTAVKLTFYFTALEVGALLKGVCNFAEEINHVTARHHGSYWQALNACVDLRRHLFLLLVCGAAYVTVLGKDEPLLAVNLRFMCICQLLSMAFKLHHPPAVEISEITETNHLNVAHGLAWSYYIGYLKIVLPYLKDRIGGFNRAHNNLLKCKETWKLHILLPLSCEIHSDLGEADSNIRSGMDLPELSLDRGGTKRRSYKHTVYEILDEDKKNYCIVEYATPLLSLHAMSQDENAAFSRQDRLEQAKLFYRTLEGILQRATDCAGCYRLIVYEEPRDDNKHFLSKEILQHMQQQHKEEYTLCEREQDDAQRSTCLSTEPHILVSDSELPLPLRSDFY
uniref:Stimulator of interferon genes protein n=1 Tax=Sphenodon punctatus TaxID=8508 RepID=A0A8D0HTE1_SPHPU